MTARETADRLAEMTGGFEQRRDAIAAALTDAYRRGEESRPKVKPLETTEYERDEFDNHPGDFDHVDFARRLIRDITLLTAQVAALKEERDAANARADRLAGALRIAADDLTEASRAIERAAYSDDPKVAARLAFHIQRKAKAATALLTEPEAKGGDPAPVPATTEKTDD